MLEEVDTHTQKNEIKSLPHIIYKINSKQITDLSVRVKMMTFSKESMHTFL